MRVLLDPRRPTSPGARVTAADLVGLYAPPARRRWVRSNMVSTLDGSATGADGRSGSVNTPSDHRVFAVLRDHADAVLVGAGTVRDEGYTRLSPTRRSPVPAALVAVTRSGRVPEGLRTPTDGRGAGLLVTCSAAGERRLGRARSVLGDENVLVRGDDTVDLPAALDALAERGLRRVLLEGGPSLLGTALAAGVVDEMALSLVPRVVGGDNPRIVAGPPLTAPDGVALRPHLLLEESGTLCGLWRTR
ncbi:dihydrofolate reductase family protein [Phycicoccus sp. CSK15P-2]|uniref:dihydrofolate reductase family protein n=1 Tax=Phycicoccus sp. CSK15P-2 TaxID=2807627 RepID=UPI00194EF797|nr:dihydrofolate reductase family protein [Phycicoccus sp. CSK15P-2]MBM6403955.1 dihydrofolate reductase family protein [Phycicoccus sp. CSK15P-2]